MTDPPQDRRRRLLNSREDTTRRLLLAVAERNGAHVFSKIRVADALTIDRSGLDGDLYGYALKSHLDFVITDSSFMTQFAVEFDGPQHDVSEAVVANDKRKNSICNRLGLPLARVRDEHLFQRARGIDYLTWLAELYFSFRALVGAQEDGSLPMDEPLDPMMFMTHPHYPGQFPLFLSMEARLRLRDLAREGVVRSPSPLLISGAGTLGGRSSCLTAIALPAGTHIVSDASIYLRGFGVSPTEVAEEIAISNLAQQAAGVRMDGARGISGVALRAKVIDFVKDLRGDCHLHGDWSGLGFALSHSSHGWVIGGLGGEPEVVIPRE